MNFQIRSIVTELYSIETIPSFTWNSFSVSLCDWCCSAPLTNTTDSMMNKYSNRAYAHMQHIFKFQASRVSSHIFFYFIILFLFDFCSSITFIWYCWYSIVISFITIVWLSFVREKDLHNICSFRRFIHLSNALTISLKHWWWVKPN